MSEELTLKEAVESVKGAVVSVDHPASQMEPDKLKAVQSSIIKAYDNLMEQGLQVRFAKSTHRPAT